MLDADNSEKMVKYSINKPFSQQQVTTKKFQVTASISVNGLLDLSIIGCDPFLVDFLSALPLKSRLVSTVLGPVVR